MMVRWIAALALGAVLMPVAAGAEPVHALSLIGAPKYGPDFQQLDYVNPAAPKGGDIKLAAQGGFDSTHGFIIRGDSAPGLGLIVQSLMDGVPDDPSAEYGLIAESIDVAADLSAATFRLRAAARWHDGQPITADDVVWSFDTLKAKGAPFYRFYYANVAKAEALDPRTVKFSFTGPPNRELPQIMGQLPVLPKHWWASRDFEKTMLEAPLGSGPYRVANLEANRFIVYERVADWWAKDLPQMRGRFNYDRIRYDMYRDASILVEAFRGGQYDFRAENSALNWATRYDFPAVTEGRVLKRELKHTRPTGMQAFVMNLRRDKFADPRVRSALNHAYDFEWLRRNVFFDQYNRPRSYFQNSELAATGLPDEAELKFLEPLRGQVPPEVFTRSFDNPKTDGSGNARDNLRVAVGLLRAAGWTVKDNKLQNAKGEVFTIEFLLFDAGSERLIQPYLRNLERLGIAGSIRVVDPAQYQNRVRDFDFDIVTGVFPQSESPGNEQRDFWSTEAAGRPGSRNIAGIRNPAVDKLIEGIVTAPDRATLVAATRALDRVLQWNHYTVPQLYSGSDRYAWWNRFGQTGREPGYGVDFNAWWIDPAKDAALRR